MRKLMVQQQKGATPRRLHNPDLKLVRL